MIPLKSLTARQRDVMALVCVGLTNVEIGVALGISHRTIEIHRAEAINRLGAKNAAHAAVLYERGCFEEAEEERRLAEEAEESEATETPGGSPGEAAADQAA